MVTHHRQARRLGRTGGLALTVAVLAAVGGGPAHAAPAAPAAPQLSIALDDGRSAVTSGDSLTYAIVVTDVGATPVKGLWVTQSVPTGLRFMSADSKGVAAHGAVTWRVDLAAGALARLTSTMRVTATPKDLLRLAPVACATSTRGGPPIVCASHSDQLPAGAAAQAAAAAAAASDSSSSGLPVWSYGVGGVVVLAGLASLVLIRRRRVVPDAHG